MHNRDEIHVVGGGLGGLATAAHIARAGHRVVVHESRRRLGGRATTDERDGYRFNQGPHALYAEGHGMDVLRGLGIQPRGSRPPSRGVTVRDRSRYLAPAGPLSLLATRLLGAREKVELARLFLRLPRIQPGDWADASVAEWLDAELRHRRVQATVAALVRLTTYANAPDSLSADVAIGQLQLGLGDGVLYLDGGWQQLVDALAAVPGIEIVEDDAVTELPDAAAVVVATGGPAQARRLTGHHFETGPPAETSSLDLGLRGDPPCRFTLGIDEPMYLSEHSIAAGLAPVGGSNVVVAEYLAPGSDPDRQRLERFARTAGITDDRVETRRYLHRMPAVTAIPLAVHGGLAGRPGVQVPGCPGVFVAGDWVGHEGHLADAVLASARAAAREAVRHVERRPVSR